MTYEQELIEQLKSQLKLQEREHQADLEALNNRIHNLEKSLDAMRAINAD